jgi:hypothetical protein
VPYRKLPKTDESRLRALQTLLGKDDIYTVQHRVVEWKDISDAEAVLAEMQRAQRNYRTALTAQMRSSEKYKASIKQARMFLSHFIQVLNMSMERGEIKEAQKPLYGLTVGNFAVPEMTTEQQVIDLGKHIIHGERERLKKGGVPIYNPTIAKVSVQYDIFLDLYNKKTQLQEAVEKCVEASAELRDKADAVILSIWNQVEARFADLPDETRYAKCREYGVVYYYRRGEKHDLF